MFRVSLGVFLALSIAASPGIAEDNIKLGSWNIKQLSDAASPRVGDLTRVIRLSGVDVLALQEIHDTDSDTSTLTNSKLDEVFEQIEQATNQHWKYVLHDPRPDSRNQQVGVAWNSDRVTMDGTPFRIDVDYANEETWKRTPYAVKFKTREGKTDFVVISLHMKSNNPIDGLPPTEEIRRLEAKALVDQLSNVRDHFGGEKDIVLIGDTNAKRSSESAIQEYKDAGYRDLNEKDAATWRSYFRGQERLQSFDRVFVPVNQPEFRDSRQFVLQPADRREFEENISDHWPILTTILIDNDDDP